MPATSAAMELKVLINILSSGTALKTLLQQTNDLSQALNQLQTKAQAGGTGSTNTATAAAAQLAAAAAASAKAIGASGQAAGGAVPAMAALAGAVDKVTRAVKFMAGGFLAFQSVRFLKNIADVAARTEVLNTVMHVVARNAGVSAQRIDAVASRVQRLGITAQSAYESLTKFMQAKLDVSFAEPLARAAQDLAVISGMDSSATFSRLLVNIQQLDTLGLRWMGIIVNRTAAEAKYAAEIHKSVSALNQQEKQQALLNAVLEKARGLEGAYEAAMGNVGKQLTSLTRYTQDLTAELGKHLLPAYSAIVAELSLFLAKMQDVAIEGSANLDWAEQFGEVVRDLSHKFFGVIEILVDFKDAIFAVTAAYAAFWALVAGKAVLGHIASVFTTLTGAVISFGLACTQATKATTAFGLSLQFIQGLGMIALFTALAYSLYEVAKAFAAAEEAESEGRLWDFLKKSVFEKDTDNWVRRLIGKGDVDQAKRDIRAASGEIQDELSRNRRALAYARDAEMVAQTKAVRAKKSGAPKIEVDTAEAEYKVATDRRKKLEEDRLKIQEDLRKKGDTARLEADARYEAQQARLEELNKVSAAAQEAATKLPVSVLEGIITPREFAEKDAQLRALTQDFINLRTEAMAAGDAKAWGPMVDAALRSIEAAKLGAQSVTSKAALKQYRQSIQEQLIDTGQATDEEMKGLLPRLDRLAALNAQQGELRLFAPLEAIRAAYFKSVEDKTKNSLEEQLSIVKTTNQKTETLNKESYDRTLITIDQYYAERRRMANNEYSAQLALAASEIQTLERKQRGGYAKTEQERLDLQAQLDAARAARRELDRQKEVTDTTTDAEQRTAIEARRDTVKEASLGIAAAYGSEKEALDVLENTERLRVKQLGGGDEAKRIAAQERTLATLQKQNELAAQREDAELKAIRAREGVINIAQMELDVEKQKAAARQDAGQMGAYEGMRLRNQLLSRQIALDMEKLRGKEEEQAEKLLQLKRQISYVEALRGAKFDENSQQMITAKAAVQATEAEINGLNAGIVTLGGTIDTAASKMESYGKQIKEHFVDSFSDALTQSITDFQNAGKVWISLSQSISNEIVGIFAKAFSERLFKKLGLFNLVDQMMNKIFGGGGGGTLFSGGLSPGLARAAEGGVITGPGTGTSDSIPAMLSAGEHVMPAAKAARFMPLLEGIRTGKILPFANGGMVQSIALGSVIPRRYAGGGVVTDGGASTVTPGGAGGGNMIVSLHPDAMNMTMREWLEQEVMRQHGRR